MSWMFWKKAKAELTEDQRAALKRLVADAKYELIPLDSVMAKCEALPPGAAVTVTASPSHGIEATFDLCEALAARGHDVTPHLSAHMTRDRAHLQELLDRARAAQYHEGLRGRRRREGQRHVPRRAAPAAGDGRARPPVHRDRRAELPRGPPRHRRRRPAAGAEGQAAIRHRDDDADVLQPARRRRRGSPGCAPTASRSRCTSACPAWRSSPSS